MIKNIREITKLFAILLMLTPMVACKGLFNTKLFKERASETPAPDDQTIDKSFFVNPDGKPKTFLCAYAPEIGRGIYGERWFTALVNETPHCNVEFEIKQDTLVGKRIHPSYPNDRSRWVEIIQIPITKHFYFEREKDQHGRETNRWIENDSRSHWSARPKIKLNLQSVSMPGLGNSDLAGLSGGSTSAYEIEWDKQRNFLGFSVDMKFWGEALQAKFRFNFLEFKHDPTFVKTPYHQENSRLMNILHVMGRKADGIEPELYAAHWDLRKTNTIYLNGVPKEHEKTVLAAIEKWNKTLRDIGAIGPNDVAFKGEVANFEHPFDLRYPSFNWIQDSRLSLYSPLGIGMAHADVRNGKILWGSVNIYGGMLERYINAYTPLEASGPDGGPRFSDPLSPIKFMSELFSRAYKTFADPERVRRASDSNAFMNQMQLMNPTEMIAKMTQEKSQSQIESLKQQLAQMRNGNPETRMILADVIGQASKEADAVKTYFQKVPLVDHFGSGLLKKAAASRPEDKAAAQNQKGMMAQIFAEKDLGKRQQLIQNLLSPRSSFTIEEGLTVANMSGAWMNSEARKNRSLPELLDSVVMDLTLHELGHFLGLGHQFKENIVPQEGTVPSKYVKDLSAKATLDKGFLNMTSVMGYRSGRTEMITPVDTLNPGPHDELVLRYLYKREYSTFDKDADQFVYGRVPDNGKIPMYSQLGGKRLPVSYFPQCNDFEASLGADPFCNRWDRGSDAVDIVKSYFEHISDNLISNLYSVVGGGGNVEMAEWGMWNSALDSFSRVRLFYDEMRRRLRSEEHLKPLWNRLRTDKAALLEFSQACQKPDPTSAEHVSSPVLREIFADKAIADLCRANLIALNEFNFYLNLPDSDYARIDHSKRYISGGYLEGDATRNWGHMFGSWYQMSNLPLKISSFYTLTTATPYMLGWWGLSSNPYYDHEQNRYLYRTLYPMEFTKLVSESVQNNMRFAALGMNDTTGIGRTVLAAGSMLPWMSILSNEDSRLTDEYNTLLDQQSEFQYSMVAVVINPIEQDSKANGKAEHYKKFTATVYDFYSDKMPSTAKDVYVLPEGKVFVWAPGMFLYPLGPMKFFAGRQSYVIAYKISYDYKPSRDKLVQDSVKSKLTTKHDQIARTCTEGFDGSGASKFFTADVPNCTPESKGACWDGLLIPEGIAKETGDDKIQAFYKSVDKAWDRYEMVNAGKIPRNFPQSMRGVCEESIRGVGQISAAAALINGYWLSNAFRYLEK